MEDGKKYRWRKVDWEGNTAYRRGDFMSQIGTHEGTGVSRKIEAEDEAVEEGNRREVYDTNQSAVAFN